MKSLQDPTNRSKQNYSRNLSMCTLLLAVTTVLFIMPCAPNYVMAETGKVNVVHWIGIDQLDSIIEEKMPVIVDLRTPLEYEQGHLPGAVNVPVDNLRVNRSLLHPYKDKPVLLYCRTVNKTGRALWMLEGQGFNAIYALRGGYEAYRLRGRQPLRSL
jgi:rhodanese-related sulfurtransferase